MKINFAHLCDYALISQDQKLSVLGLFTVVLAQTIPWPHPQFFVAFEIGFEPAELNHPAEVRIECVDEDGQGLFKMEGKVTPQGTARIGDRPAIPQIIAINNLVFARAGAYDVNFWLNNHLDHVIHFQIMPPGWTPKPPSKGSR